MVAAALDLRARLPFVVGAEQSWTIATDGGLDRSTSDRQLADLHGTAAQDAGGAVKVTDRRRVPGTGRVVLRIEEPSDADIPHRAGRRRIREVAERDSGHSRAPTNRCLEGRDARRRVGVDPELVVNALHQLPARGEPPRQLGENLVLLVGPRECRVDPGLTGIVTKMLIAAEEPQPIVNHRSAEVRRHVAVLVPLVSGFPRGRQGTKHRLTCQTRCLSVVRRVEQQAIAPLSRQNIDHRPLHVAELDGRASGLDLHFLNEVHTGLGSRNAVAWAREVRPIDEELVLVGAGAKRRHSGLSGRRGARRRCR